MGGYTRTVSEQRFHKRVPIAMNRPATKEVLMEAVFLNGPCQGVIRRTTGATNKFCMGVCEERT
jgi:hypothetical protein